MSTYNISHFLIFITLTTKKSAFSYENTHFIHILSRNAHNYALYLEFNGVYKTKDGKIWFYKTQYEDIDGTHKTKKSGIYTTKKEAENAEFEFKLKIREYENMRI